MPHWFKPIPIYTKQQLSRKTRLQVALHVRKYGEYRVDLDRPTPKPVSLQLIYNSNIGKKADISGVSTKVFGIVDIAKLYKLNYETPLKWYKDGYLPKPYLESKKGRGRSPIYISPQMRVILRVLNDIYRQGVKSIRWDRLEKHLDMMDEGNEIALASFGDTSVTQYKEEMGGKFGVSWK